MVFSALLQRIELEIGQCEGAHSTWARIPCRGTTVYVVGASNVNLSYSSCSGKPMNDEQEIRVYTSMSREMNWRWQKLVRCLIDGVGSLPGYSRVAVWALRTDCFKYIVSLLSAVTVSYFGELYGPTQS